MTVAYQELPRMVFYSRPRLALRMLDLLDLKPDDCLLEPSVGRGDLVRPVVMGVKPTPKKLIMVDIDDECCRSVKEGFRDFLETPAKVYCANFLHVTLDVLSRDRMPRPTAIAMVPPFGYDEDIRHILNAWRLLQPGGRMAAVCSEQAFVGDGRVPKAFQNWLDEVAAYADPLSPENFRNHYPQPLTFRSFLITMKKPAQ